MYICPSYGRPERLQRLDQSLVATGHKAFPLIVVLDENQKELYERYDYKSAFTFIYVSIRGVNNILNEMFKRYPWATSYGVIADDCVIRTGEALYKLEELAGEYSVAFGNDLHWGPEIPTHPCIGGAFLRALGYWSEPRFLHNGPDKVWAALGRMTGLLRYDPTIVIEHEHPAFHKAQWDPSYLVNYNPHDSNHFTPQSTADEEAFKLYIADGSMKTDLAFIKDMLQVRTNEAMITCAFKL